MDLAWSEGPVITLPFLLRKKRKRYYIIENFSLSDCLKDEHYKLNDFMIIIKMIIIKIIIIIKMVIIIIKEIKKNRKKTI